MECGIVGLPSVGKTALFNALTGAHASAFSSDGGGMKPHIGIAAIPDPQLDVLSEFFPGRKVIHATMKLVDIPGVPPGSPSEKLTSFFSHVRQVDAICHVVRCFDDGTGRVEPLRDIEDMETELIIADMAVAESSLDRASRAARSGDADAKARQAVLERVIELLNDGRPIRTRTDWSDAERVFLKGYGMITAKPELFVLNVGEEDLAGKSSAAQSARQHLQSASAESVVICAKLEAELAEIEDSDRGEMLESLGLTEPAIGPLAQAAHRLLGMGEFYTAGDKEVRAWPVRLGASAPEAAGEIHSDLQRGFIRAECYSIDDLLEYKTEKAIREAGRLRSEGKHYRVQERDVILFLFNV